VKKANIHQIVMLVVLVLATVEIASSQIAVIARVSFLSAKGAKMVLHCKAISASHAQIKDVLVVSGLELDNVQFVRLITTCNLMNVLLVQWV